MANRSGSLSATAKSTTVQDSNDVEVSLQQGKRKGAQFHQSDSEIKRPKPNALDGGGGEEEYQKSSSFVIEADAAEDKGSRHLMEDAWVVLLDASLGSPGNLRF